MIFKFFVLFGLLGAVSSRGVRADKDQFAVNDDFRDKSLGGGLDSNLLEKAKPPGEAGADASNKEGGAGGDASNEEGEAGGGPSNEEGEKRRKFVNGRSSHFQSMNASLEFPSGKENGTWNVEKKVKTLDLGKEVIKTCQVTTEELVATAQATVTRALKGLCNSKDMDERFGDLEQSVTTQLNTIKQMILNLEDSLNEHGDAVLYGQKQISAAISKTLTAPGNGNGGPLASSNEFGNKNQKSPHEYPTSKVTPNGKNGGVDASDEDEDVSGIRDPEILKFNSSIHVETSLNGPPRKVFTYYWKIKDMMFKLTGWNPRKSLRSQSFYIFPSGYRMYMRVFPRKNEDNFYVRVGLTKGEFDDTLKWPFPLKHKIHILDQTKEGRLFEDIASRIWDPNLLCSDFNWQKPITGDNHECVEIGFPHDVLRQREYIRKDALVIKLTVYLES